jgi:hypothetical protein
LGVETQRVEDFRLAKEPYYLPLGNEVELFEAAYYSRLPVMLKGPTGWREDAVRGVYERGGSSGRSSPSPATRISPRRT